MVVRARASELSAPQKRLLSIFQSVNFGRVEGLVVRDGEPVFDPAPRVIREHKFGGENGPRRELGLRDFELKAQARELLEQLGALPDGTVVSIEVHHGLPFRMSYEERG